VCKTVTQATLASGAPDGTVPNVVETFTYDPSGRILTSTDSLNRTTSYAYYGDTAFSASAPNELGHTVGDLQSITNAAGMVVYFNTYDRLGRILQSTDPKGITTQTSYTARGWVSTVSTTAPGAGARTTTYSYDGAGQLIGVSAPDGTTLSFTYDAAHRLTGASDPRGNTVAYTLDNLGNRIGEQVKDPTGVLQRAISRSFDALNRLQQVSGATQ
jgi:YD repeat-containing protein